MTIHHVTESNCQEVSCISKSSACWQVVPTVTGDSDNCYYELLVPRFKNLGEHRTVLQVSNTRGKD